MTLRWTFLQRGGGKQLKPVALWYITNGLLSMDCSAVDTQLTPSRVLTARWKGERAAHQRLCTKKETLGWAFIKKKNASVGCCHTTTSILFIFFLFIAFISMRNYSGLLNPVSVSALLWILKTTAFFYCYFYYFLMTALSVVGLIPFGRDNCTVK